MGDSSAQEADDGDALLIAMLLRAAVSTGNVKAVRTRLISDAVRKARKWLGRDRLARGTTYGRRAARSRLEVLRLAAETVEQHGQLNLSANMLEAIQLVATGPIDTGRVIADRARNARKRGDASVATAQYIELLRIGKRHDSPELVAAAYIGLSALAQVRGNLAEMTSLALRAARIADTHGLRRIAATAYGALGIQAAGRSDFDTAVIHLWKSYRLSVGDDAARAELLTNLGQVFLMAGHAKEAHVASAVVLGRKPSRRIALPALGAFAMAAATLGNDDEVHWAAAQVRRLAKSRGHAREIAGALAECAAALRMIGEESQAGVLHRRAEALAEKHGFFDLTFAESLAVRPAAPARLALTRSAALAALEVERLHPRELPSHLELIGAN